MEFQKVTEADLRKIEDLMWEDTKHASGVKVDWFQAKMYCEDLNLAGIRGWKMPT